jgi:hypothetical protein
LGPRVLDSFEQWWAPGHEKIGSVRTGWDRTLIAVAGAVGVTVGAGLLGAAFTHHDAHHPGGDPGGRLVAAMVPLVRVVPGFEHGPIPWETHWCDSCKIPTTYALKIEPGWDNCYGVASTAGWDPAIIQIGFVSSQTGEALAKTIDTRVAPLGWVVGPSPSWSSDQAAFKTWNFPNNQEPSQTLTLDTDVYPDSWMVVIQTRAIGPYIDCGR